MRRSALGLISATVFLAFAGSAAAFAATPQDCANRLHGLLSGPPAEAFAVAEAARAGSSEMAPPEAVRHLRFDRSRNTRSSEERLAYATAKRLVEEGERAAWMASANDRWVVDRVMTDLSAFIAQPPSPYLCGGVENFVAILQTYLDRVAGTGSGTLERLTNVQEIRARSAVAAAEAIMRPVPAPRFSPDRRPIALVKVGGAMAPVVALRRDRRDGQVGRGPVVEISQNAAARAFGPYIDQGLPIRRKLELGSEAERIRAANRLVEAARKGGFLPGRRALSVVMEVDAGRARRGAFETTLDTVALALRKEETVPRDRFADDRLQTAFSELELLDVLSKAEASGGDPVLSAIEKTFAAILGARNEAASGP